MGAKEWVSQQQQFGLYQDLNFDTEEDVNESPAVIQIENPDDYKIESLTLSGGVFSKLTVEIPAEVFDEFCRQWVKKRNLNTNKYTLEELLVKCSSESLVSEDELTDRQDCVSDDVQLKGESEKKPKQELDYNNIFDAVTLDENEANRLKKLSDLLIKYRDVSELKGIFKGLDNADNLEVGPSYESLKKGDISVAENASGALYMVFYGGMGNTHVTQQPAESFVKIRRLIADGKLVLNGETPRYILEAQQELSFYCWNDETKE